MNTQWRRRRRHNIARDVCLTILTTSFFYSTPIETVDGYMPKSCSPRCLYLGMMPESRFRESRTSTALCAREGKKRSGGFFSKKEPEPEPEKEGGVLGVFRKSRKEDKKNIDSETQKKTKTAVFKDALKKVSFKSRDDNDDTKSKDAQSKAAKDDSSLKRFQDFVASKKTKRKDTSDGSEKSSKNPLSAMQKFTGTFFKDKKDSSKSSTWYPAFSKTRIMPGETVPVTVAGLDLLVIATKDGRIYCMANSCPHLGTPLETGQLVRLPIEDSGYGMDTLSDRSDDIGGLILTETDVSNILSRDGCEDCLVCPLHRTAFALQSGQVRGEWCPYPPILGAMAGVLQPRTPADVFEARTRGKNVEVRISDAVVAEAATAAAVAFEGKSRGGSKSRNRGETDR